MKTDDIIRMYGLEDLEDKLGCTLLTSELDIGESGALECADRFLNDWADWNEDAALKMACNRAGHDYDFAWLLIRVLFGPAVVWLKTGKAV